MLFNDDVLFIHTPKTAGTSLTAFLIENLEGDMYISIPEGRPFRSKRGKTIHIIPGSRHLTFQESADIVAAHGRRLDSFKRIISVVRNPYALEVSRFHYLQLERIQSTGQSKKLATAGDFLEFCREAPFVGVNPPDIKQWYSLNGALLPNQYIIRFESLADGLRNALRGVIDMNMHALPHKNSTSHDNYKKYLSREIERSIYTKYRWLFDKGFYERDTQFAKPGLAPG